LLCRHRVKYLQGGGSGGCGRRCLSCTLYNLN